MLSALIRLAVCLPCVLLVLPVLAQSVPAGATSAAPPGATASPLMRKFNLPPVSKTSRLDVVYLGSEDCTFCQQWEFGSRVKLLESREARAFNFHEIKNSTLSKPFTPADYPAGLEWVHAQVGATRGVPRFLLAIDGRVVLNSYGTGGYQRNFLPALNEVVRVSGKMGA
jgi:hypothetical protein